MRDRLKAIRSTLKQTQAEFAKTIGLTRATIASYEGGHLDVSERTINDICRVHNINEQWLRTGQGPMFRQQSDIDNQLAAEVAKLIQSEDEFTKKLIAAYLALPDDAKDKVREFVSTIMK